MSRLVMLNLFGCAGPNLAPHETVREKRLRAGDFREDAYGERESTPHCKELAP